MFKKFFRRMLYFVASAAVAIAAYLLYLRNADITNVEVKGTVTDEAQSIKKRIDERCGALDRKLDDIEGKLDRILGIITPELPDGLEPR